MSRIPVTTCDPALAAPFRVTELLDAVRQP